jgi:hypothetical protein
VLKPKDVVNVIDTYEAMMARAEQDGVPTLDEQKAWARKATAVLLTPGDPGLGSQEEPPRPGDHRLCPATGHTAPGRCPNCGITYVNLEA